MTAHTTSPARPVEMAAATPRTSSLSILIADKFEKSGVDALNALGCQVTTNTELTPETLPGTLKQLDPDVLIVRGSKVNKAALEAAGKLSLVVRAGAGYDTIDVATASARGIYVANCPGKNAIAVAELVWALILSCDRRMPDQAAELRAGTWNKKEYSKAEGLFGRTLGIVGLGQIGQEVAARGQAFGMKVVAWSRHLSEAKADALGIGWCSNIINLAKMSDVVSVNVAGNAETARLIDEKFFQAMKPGSTFINSSRGSVIDQAALATAIKEKGLRAGLDVFANEPAGGSGPFTDDIVKLPGVYGTHHVGASTNQAQNAIAAETVRIIATYLKTGQVLNCVNRASATPATIMLTVRHLNKPGVLAHVFYTLGQGGINVEEMENIIYDGAKAACARIQLDDSPTADQLNAIGRNENVLSATLSSIQRS